MNDFLASMPTVSTNENEPQQKTSMLDFALMYAVEGLRVLPLHSLRFDKCTCNNADCRNSAKHPITRNGVKDATCDAAQIRAWWQQYPYANVGIATGNGLLVIDIDPRHGGSLEALKQLVSLPATALLRTGGGGLHLYFSYDPALVVRNSSGKLAAGIDVRGENGYVVAPPSTHASGNRYRWDLRIGYTPAPSALLNLLVEKKPAQTPGNQPPSQEVAHSPGASPESRFILEGKRNATLVSLAGSLRKQGANEEAMFIVLQALNKGCCQPPLTEAEVRLICKSAIQWTPGTNGPAASHEAMIVQNVASLMESNLMSPPWAIPGLLPEGVSLLAGKPKMGKSWLALSLALSIACGGPALGQLTCKQGTVLYLGLEDNAQRICSRVGKMLQNAHPPKDLFWSGICTPLTMGGLRDIEAWITSVEQPRLIVIDTLARVRSQNGSSGNVYADDYAAITPLKQMAEQYHLSILLIHHLRKADASDPMDEISGSTGLTGATDCNMVLQRERGMATALLHVTGRDVEDQALNLIFDTQLGLWSITDAPSHRAALSSVRQEIITLLRQKDRPLGPAEIATELKLDYDVVRKRLSLMKKDEQLFSVGRGLYQIAPLAPLQETIVAGD